jgi:hypothetical protein
MQVAVYCLCIPRRAPPQTPQARCETWVALTTMFLALAVAVSAAT